MLLKTFIFFNALFIIFYIIANFAVFKLRDMPKLKAFCGVTLTLFFALYFLMIIIISAKCALNDTKAVLLLLFILLPLLIGRAVEYKTLIFYSFLQTAVLTASLVFSLKLL